MKVKHRAAKALSFALAATMVLSSASMAFADTGGEAEPVVKKEETLNVTAIIEAFYASAEQKKEINCAEIINK